MVLLVIGDFDTICRWYRSCGLELGFHLAVLLAGQANIDKTNLVSVMSHPLSLLALLVFIMVFAFLFMLEMRTLISVIYLSRTDRHLSFKRSCGNHLVA